MSQPFDRSAKCPAPGKVDESLGEFWSGDPWLIGRKHNLSAFERNRAYLNVGGANFVDISYTSSLDSDGDGRAAVATDIDNDGQMDLIVRQVSGGPFRIYTNQFPKKNWLKVSLRGETSHSQGIGAKITVHTENLKITRELFPHNTFYSQAPAMAHFGLGSNDVINKITIRWPGSSEQTLENIQSNQHILVHEGKPSFEKFGPEKEL